MEDRITGFEDIRTLSCQSFNGQVCNTVVVFLPGFHPAGQTSPCSSVNRIDRQINRQTDKQTTTLAPIDLKRIKNINIANIIIIIIKTFIHQRMLFFTFLQFIQYISNIFIYCYLTREVIIFL